MAVQASLNAREAARGWAGSRGEKARLRVCVWAWAGWGCRREGAVW